MTTPKWQWTGVFPALTTKFLEDDSLDFQMMNTNVEAQLSAGVHGLILGGSLGEGGSLDQGEKNELLQEVVNQVNGRVPVIMNVAEATTKNAIARVRDAEANGAEGIMLLPPMRYASDARETVAYFKSIADSTGLPIMIYNNPVDYKTEVTLDMFEKLTECSNITAVKESTRDLTNVTRMRNAFQDRFSILSGVDTLALESLLMGADGWVAGLVCAFPEETVAIFELARAGKLEEARQIYQWFMPLLELDINAKLVQNIKLAEVATGLGTERVRAPRLPLVGAEREEVLDIINRSLATRPVTFEPTGA